jgi:hypothetical protein
MVEEEREEEGAEEEEEEEECFLSVWEFLESCWENEEEGWLDVVLVLVFWALVGWICWRCVWEEEVGLFADVEEEDWELEETEERDWLLVVEALDLGLEGDADAEPGPQLTGLEVGVKGLGPVCLGSCDIGQADE